MLLLFEGICSFEFVQTSPAGNCPVMCFEYMRVPLTFTSKTLPPGKGRMKPFGVGIRSLFRVHAQSAV